MKKQVWYEDEGPVAHGQGLQQPLTQDPGRSTHNNAVQLLLQNKFATANKKSKNHKNVDKQFFNPNPASFDTTARLTGSTPQPPPAQNANSGIPLKSGPIPATPMSSMKPEVNRNSSLSPSIIRPKKEVAFSKSSMNKSSKVKTVKSKISKHSPSQTQQVARYRSKSEVTPKKTSKTGMEKTPLRRHLTEYSYSNPRSKSRANFSKSQKDFLRYPASVQEAAANLSFPWPKPNNSKPGTPDYDDNSLTPTEKKTRLLKDIQEFFESHQELLELPGVKKAMNKTKNLPKAVDSKLSPGELDQSLDAVMTSLKIVFLQNGLPGNFRRSEEYKPVAVPEWEEVATGWPGFESKPLPDWTNYAKPTKLKPKAQNEDKKDVKGQGKKADQEKDGAKNGNKSKKPKARR